MALTREEQDRLADEYIEKHFSVTKENALRDMRLSMDLHLTKNGKFYSIVANQYRDMLSEYAIYCKEEDFERWQDMCQELIDSIISSSDADWLYDAWIVEATAKLMITMDGEIDWNRVKEVVSEQGHTAGTVSEVAQMLIAYSPNGLLFVDHIIKPRSIYKEMKGLRNAYGTEVNRRMRQEMKEKKQLGTRLVKCLGVRVTNLNRENN